MLSTMVRVSAFGLGMLGRATASRSALNALVVRAGNVTAFRKGKALPTLRAMLMNAKS